MDAKNSANNPSVASVTVAYNASPILRRQMDALFGQTRPLQEVVLVDNGSTDGTAEMIARDYPQATLLRIKSNGSPGTAISKGMVYAIFEKHYEWFWLLDADSVPEPETLECLLDGLRAAEGFGEPIGMVAPLLFHRETGEYYPPLYWREGYVKPDFRSFHDPVLFVDLVLGSGALIRHELVKTLGLFNEDMVMYFQDFEYCLRARQHGYQIAVATASKLAHEVGHARQVRLPGFPRLWSAHAPWQEYYMSRNLVYTAWHLYPSPKAKRFCLRHQSKHAIGILLFSRNKIDCLAKMAQGIWDGCLGRLGMRVRLGS